LTPDRDFIVDRVPGTDNIYVAVGAGHAFKFASLLGQILTDLALDGATPHDISALAGDRPILQEDHPVRTYMV
jgi:sarcosine oxidase